MLASKQLYISEAGLPEFYLLANFDPSFEFTTEAGLPDFYLLARETVYCGPEPRLFDELSKPSRPLCVFEYGNPQYNLLRYNVPYTALA